MSKLFGSAWRSYPASRGQNRKNARFLSLITNTYETVTHQKSARIVLVLASRHLPPGNIIDLVKQKGGL